MEVYPLVMADIAIENGPVEIVDLPSYKMVIFHSYVTVYQRVLWAYGISWVRLAVPYTSHAGYFGHHIRLWEGAVASNHIEGDI